jgi:GDP-4-dehydro-6-deoxy-D-mannose reductase
VLVTGASGFLGRAVVEEFGRAGHSVTGTSSSGSGSDGLLSLDLEQPEGFAAVLEQVRPEVVVHLAGIQSVPESWKDPARSFRVNTGGTAGLLREIGSFDAGIHFVFASSAAVYGNPSLPEGEDPRTWVPRPFVESDPLRPESPYGASKAAAEVLAIEAATRTGMPLTIARLFNQIGADQPAGQVPAGFAAEICEAASRGESEVTIEVGNPERERDYTDVRDTARALREVMEAGVTGRINFCSGRTHPLSRLIEGLGRLGGIEVIVKRKPEMSSPNDFVRLGGSADRLKQTTGWSAEVPLDESLAGLLAAQGRGDSASATGS